MEEGPFLRGRVIIKWASSIALHTGRYDQSSEAISFINTAATLPEWLFVAIPRTSNLVSSYVSLDMVITWKNVLEETMEKLESQPGDEECIVHLNLSKVPFAPEAALFMQNFLSTDRFHNWGDRVFQQVGGKLNIEFMDGGGLEFVCEKPSLGGAELWEKTFFSQSKAPW